MVAQPVAAATFYHSSCQQKFGRHWNCSDRLGVRSDQGASANPLSLRRIERLMSKSRLNYRELINRWIRTPASLVDDRRSDHSTGIEVLLSVGLRGERDPVPFQLSTQSWGVGVDVTELLVRGEFSCWCEESSVVDEKFIQLKERKCLVVVEKRLRDCWRSSVVWVRQ